MQFCSLATYADGLAKIIEHQELVFRAFWKFVLGQCRAVFAVFITENQLIYNVGRAREGSWNVSFCKTFFCKIGSYFTPKIQQILLNTGPVDANRFQGRIFKVVSQDNPLIGLARALWCCIVAGVVLWPEDFVLGHTPLPVISHDKGWLKHDNFSGRMRFYLKKKLDCFSQNLHLSFTTFIVY